MRERRRLGAECTKEQDVLRRVGKMIVAARYMRDLHVDVVNDDREVVRGITIGTKEDEVVDQLSFEADVAADQIVEADRSGLDLESDHVRAGSCGDRAAAAGVAIRNARSFGGETLRVELLDRAVASIGAAPGDQLLGAVAVARQPIALVNRAFIPFNPQPAQRTDNLLGVVLARALDVCVLDSQQHRAAVTSGVQQVKDRRASAADV